MLYLNLNVKGLNGRCHPALQNISSTNDVKRLRPHIKMLCNDLYTYEIKAAYQGGSPHCRLCQGDSDKNRSIENISHILTKCSVYSEVRTRIVHQMEIIHTGLHKSKPPSKDIWLWWRLPKTVCPLERLMFQHQRDKTWKTEEVEILTEFSISNILCYILLSLWSEDRDISNWINK